MSRQAYLARFTAEYLPLMRVVHDVPGTWFAPDEVVRIKAMTDHDDLPSVRLAIALGSCFLTEDRRALRAAYGDGIDFDRHHGWVELLKAGGDAGQLERGIIGATLVLSTIGYPVAAGARRLSAAAGPGGAAAIIGMAGAAAWCLAGVDATMRLWRSLATAGRWTGQVVADLMYALERFNESAVPSPNWTALNETLDPLDALGRASFFTLARAAASHHSAAELRPHLPHQLAVPKGEAKVRSALRPLVPASVYEPYPGRFQVGRCVLPARVLKRLGTIAVGA